MSRRPHRGFTMLEVLAALAILGIGLTVLIRSQSQSLNNVRKVANYERAVFVTENQLHWTFIELGEVDDWREVAGIGTLEDGPYRIDVSIEPTDMERQGQVEMEMLEIVATTTWQEGTREQVYTLETWFFWGESRQ